MSIPLLHLQQCSMEHSASRAKNERAADQALTSHPAVVGFTEAGGDMVRAAIRAACKDHGYQLVAPVPGNGTVLAVDGALPVLDSGARLANGPQPGPARLGGHPAKHVVWVEIDWHGEHVFVHEAHWTNRAAENIAEHQAMTRTVVELVREHGKGSALSFWMGDTNVDDDGDRSFYDPLLRAGGLTSIWDELERYPATHKHGRTIDVIGTYDPDKRVQVQRATVWPPGPLDHRRVSAWIQINQPTRKKAPR